MTPNPDSDARILVTWKIDGYTGEQLLLLKQESSKKIFKYRYFLNDDLW